MTPVVTVVFCIITLIMSSVIFKMLTSYETMLLIMTKQHDQTNEISTMS